MSERFTTTVEDEAGTEHDVVVTYTWIRPRAATHWEPEEGGCEIDDITCAITLSKKQQERIEEECTEHAWDLWRERKA